MSTPLIWQYWSGALQRLRAEVEVFSKLVGHHGEMGRENELALARMLERLLPPYIAVGTGMVIDSHGGSSRQNDIVLFDGADQPQLLAQTTQLLYPIEAVLGCIEVKTRLRSDDLKDTRRKVEAFRSLKSAAGPNSDERFYALFAYGSEVSPKSLQAALTGEDRPDVVCVLEHGWLGEPHADWELGMTLLLDDSGDPVPATSEDPYELFEGRRHPVTTTSEGPRLTDPARALLLYLEALLERSAVLATRPEPILSFYLDEQLRSQVNAVTG